MGDVEAVSKDIEWIRESLERIEFRLHEMECGCRDRHREIDVELAGLKVRAGLIGAIAGAAPALVTLVIILLQRV